jgi:hypothetical protein
MATLEQDPAKRVLPAEYIRANFQPSDRIAVLVRNRRRGETIQRISSADKVAGSSFQDWMRYKNEKDGCDVYIGMNALKPNAHTRTKDDILAIRHLYVDLDHDGSTSLAAIETSNLVPPPSYALNTSPDKYQVIWKVEEVTQGQAESLLHAIARQFDGDHAATDSARVLRVPGFLNKKYEQDFVVAIQSQTESTFHLRDFKLRSEPVDSEYRRPYSSARRTQTSEPRPISQSERDWAYVKSSLASGANPEELIAQLARSRAADKSNPQYYATLTVTKALTDLGMPQMRSGDPMMDDDDGHPKQH